MSNTTEIPEKSQQDLLLHRKPWAVPVFVAACLLLGCYAFISAGRNVPGLEAWLVQLVEQQRELRFASFVLFGIPALGALYEQWRRVRQPPMKLHVRLNRALAYGFLVAMGLLATRLHGDSAYLSALLHDYLVLSRVIAEALGLSGLAYFLVLQPLVAAKIEDLRPFVPHILAQANSYGLTIGKAYPGDWEFAEKGNAEWRIIPELGLYGNLLCLGAIGTGKTSMFADPVVMQILGKFIADKGRQMSFVALDLKGNQSKRYYEWAKEFGREEDFWVIRPDQVEGIPADRFVTFNPLMGFESPDLSALEFQDALESTKRIRSPDYFVQVQSEFLTHTLRLLNAVGDTPPDLSDVRAFAASAETRNAALKTSENLEGEDDGIVEARRYFAEEFGALDPKEQAGLLRGLSAALTILTNEAIQGTFCPSKSTEGRRGWTNWDTEVMNRPGIVVFSCPPAKYTESLSRLLGILVLKTFQQAMLRRCDAAFEGNKTRPVVLLIDEAHSFVNKGLADYMSVGRECKSCAILLTQSVAQFPPDYRDVLLENMRSRIILPVTGTTGALMSRELGEVEEIVETISHSESLQGARDAPYREGKTGRSQGVAVSKSYSKRKRVRFTADRLQHQEKFRAVAHIYDGKNQIRSEYLHAVPWYRLPYYLLNPLEHRDISCKKGGQHELIDWKCSKCGHEIETDWAREDYRIAAPVIKRLLASQAVQS